MNPFPHLVWIHGVGRSWSIDWGLGIKCKLEREGVAGVQERVHPVTWGDIVDRHTMAMNGTSRRGFFWELSDDALLYAYDAIRGEVLKRVAQAVVQIPEDGAVILGGFSWGGCVALDAAAAIFGCNSTDESRQLVGFMASNSPLRSEIWGRTHCQPRRYPFPALPMHGAVSLRCPFDPISRHRGRLGDQWIGARDELVLTWWGPHTGGAESRRLIQELATMMRQTERGDTP